MSSSESIQKLVQRFESDVKGRAQEVRDGKNVRWLIPVPTLRRCLGDVLTAWAGRALTGHEEFVAELVMKVAALQDMLDRVRGDFEPKLAAALADALRLETELARVAAERDALHQQLERTNAELAREREARLAAERGHTEARTALDRSRGELDDLRRRLAEAEAGRGDLARRLAALQADRDAVVAELDATRSERGGLRADRDAVIAERDVIIVERDALLAERAALLEERDQALALAKRAAEMERELGVRDTRLAELERLLAEARRQLADLQEKLAELGDPELLAAMIERLRLLELERQLVDLVPRPDFAAAEAGAKAANNDRARRDAARAAERYRALLSRSSETGAPNLRAFVELSRMARLGLALEREVGATTRPSADE